MFSSTIVGALACQKSPYLRQLTTKVVGCTEHTKTKKDGPAFFKNGEKYYEVELEDTILFPEGGGQPSDSGSINDTRVEFIRRDGLLAKHITNQPIEVGETVEVKVDWKKRFDHMQQHTGQHLLSAVLDQYNLPTLSWKMADSEQMINYLEVPRKISEAELEEVSLKVQDYILQSIPITVEVPEELESVTHKVPEDYDLSKGVLRVIHIGDLDANPCCGTHLLSTSHIQSLMLLHQQPVRGDHSRLYFTCGERVVRYGAQIHSIVRSLVGKLSCQPEDLPNATDSLSAKLKKANATARALLEELAQGVAQKIQELSLGDSSKVGLHFKDKGLDFLTDVYKQTSVLYEKDLAKIGKPVILAAGEQGAEGCVMVFGDGVKEVGEDLKKQGVRGGGKDKWQGKGALTKEVLDILTA